MLFTRSKTLRLAAGFLETVNLVSLRLWSRNSVAARSFHGEMFRTYMSHWRDGRWSSRSFHELFPQARSLRAVIEHVPDDGIHTPLEELAFLALITRAIQPSVVFEIGTFRGRTALNFALNAPQDAMIYTVDLPPEERHAFCQATHEADAAIIQRSRTGELFRDRPEASRICQIFANSLTHDFRPYHGTADLVFVDGAHHYEAARKDTLTALAVAKPGAWILWHDFANYGDYHDVTRAVLELIPGNEVFQLGNTQLAAYQRKAELPGLPALADVPSPNGRAGA